MSNKFWIRVLPAESQGNPDGPPLKKFILAIDPAWTAANLLEQAKQRFAANYGDIAHLTETFSNVHDPAGAEIPDDQNIRQRYKPGAGQHIIIYVLSSSPNKRKLDESSLNTSSDGGQNPSAAKHCATSGATTDSPTKAKKPRLSASIIRATSVARKTIPPAETDSDSNPTSAEPAQKSHSIPNADIAPRPKTKIFTQERKVADQSTIPEGPESRVQYKVTRTTPTASTKTTRRSPSTTPRHTTPGSIHSLLERRSQKWSPEDDAKFNAAFRSGDDATTIQRLHFSDIHSLDAVLVQYRKYEDAWIQRYKHRSSWPETTISSVNWGDRQDAKLHRAFRAGLDATTTKERFFRNYSESAFRAKWKAYGAQMMRLGLHGNEETGNAIRDTPPLIVGDMSLPIDVETGSRPKDERNGPTDMPRKKSVAQTTLLQTPHTTASTRPIATSSSRKASSSRSSKARASAQRQTKLGFELIAPPQLHATGKGKKSTIDTSNIAAQLDLRYPRQKSSMTSDLFVADGTIVNEGQEHPSDERTVDQLDTRMVLPAHTSAHALEDEDSESDDDIYEDASSVILPDPPIDNPPRAGSEEPEWQDAPTSKVEADELTLAEPLDIADKSESTLEPSHPETEANIDLAREERSTPSQFTAVATHPSSDDTTRRASAVVLRVLEAVEIPLASAFVDNIDTSRSATVARKPSTCQTYRVASGGSRRASPLPSTGEGEVMISLAAVNGDGFDPIDSTDDDGTPSLTSTTILRDANNAPRSPTTRQEEKAISDPFRAGNDRDATSNLTLRRQLTFQTGTKTHKMQQADADLAEYDPVITDEFDEDFLSQSHTLKEYVSNPGPLFRPKKVQEQIESEADRMRMAFDRRRTIQPVRPASEETVHKTVEHVGVAQSTVPSTLGRTDPVFSPASSLRQVPDHTTCPTSPTGSQASMSAWITGVPLFGTHRKRVVQVPATQPEPKMDLPAIDIESDDESDPINDLKILDSQQIDAHLDMLPDDVFANIDLHVTKLEQPATETVKSALKPSKVQVAFQPEFTEVPQLERMPSSAPATTSEEDDRDKPFTILQHIHPISMDRNGRDTMIEAVQHEEDLDDEDWSDPDFSEPELADAPLASSGSDKAIPAIPKQKQLEQDTLQRPHHEDEIDHEDTGVQTPEHGQAQLHAGTIPTPSSRIGEVLDRDEDSDLENRMPPSPAKSQRDGGNVYSQKREEDCGMHSDMEMDMNGEVDDEDEDENPNYVAQNNVQSMFSSGEEISPMVQHDDLKVADIDNSLSDVEDSMVMQHHPPSEVALPEVLYHSGARNRIEAQTSSWIPETSQADREPSASSLPQASAALNDAPETSSMTMPDTSSLLPTSSKKEKKSKVKKRKSHTMQLPTRSDAAQEMKKYRRARKRRERRKKDKERKRLSSSINAP